MSSSYYFSHKKEHQARMRKYYLKNKQALLLKIAQYRKANPGKKNQWRNNLRNKRRQFLNEIKSVPCADCGKRFPPYVMDFHHKDPKKKKFTLGHVNFGTKATIKEIKKCDIICANCHRIRTWKENHESKSKGIK